MQSPRFVHSYWRETPPAATTPPLGGFVTADVVIVGGGIIGLSCAYYLSKAGADVVLLEREAIGSQSSTRNYGELSAIWDIPHSLSLEKRRQLAAFNLGAVRNAVQLIKDEGIDCNLLENNFWLLAKGGHDSEDAKLFEADLKNLGFDCGLVDADNVPVTTQTVRGALWVKQAVTDPYKYIEGLKDAAIRQGARIHEFSEVVELQGGKDAMARTAHGQVTANKAIIAVNALAGRFGLGGDLSIPAHIFSLATKPLSPELAQSVGPTDDEIAMDLGDRGDQRYFQRMRPNGQLLFGGGPLVLPSDDEIETPILSQHMFDTLYGEMLSRYPQLAEVELDLAWGGSVSGTVGERPIMAPLPSDDALIVAQFCNGRSMGLGSSAGILARGLIEGPNALDADSAAFLEFCKGPTELFEKLEGMLFRLARTGGVRSALNLFFSRK